MERSLAVALISLVSVTAAQAAPMLRLANSVIGPVWVSSGSSGPTQTAEAHNAGDGSLSLAVSSTASWAAPSVGSSRACSAASVSLNGFSGSCLPIQIALNTSALAAGVYSADITVTDPNAIDAPQKITVAIHVGDSVSVYVSPGKPQDIPLAAGSAVNWAAQTQNGGNWLSLALDGSGSFRFSYAYRLHLAPPAGMAEGVYTGSVAITQAVNPADDRTIAVNIGVTSQPIAQASADRVHMQATQGGSAVYSTVSVANLGLGTLTLQSATPHAGSWLTATVDPVNNYATLKFDPGALAPGLVTGSVDIASNAIGFTGTITIPVEFEVVAKGIPLAGFGGVVDAAVASTPVSPGDIVSVYGEQFTFSDAANGPVPLPTILGTTSVLFNGIPAPLYYVGHNSGGYDQINLQVPMEAQPGTGLVQVQRDGLNGNIVSVNVAARAPRLLQIGAYAAAVNAMDGSLPMPVGYPIVWAAGTHPARVGDVLEIFGIGFGPTTVAVADGAPAPGGPNLAWTTVAPTVQFGGAFAGIGGVSVALQRNRDYYGLSPYNAGLYQINVTVPQGAPTGDVPVTLIFPDTSSNTVTIALK
jgi:uncharacterized protein (TIGR03437 family)